MKNMEIVDANLILRYLLNDDEHLTGLAAEIIATIHTQDKKVIKLCSKEI
jgi:predicted nucleic-acid-binding protein